MRHKEESGVITMAAMNTQQQELVEKHLYLVRNTVLGTISINESIQGLGYDDLYQTGCEALCHAALKYREDAGASFPTFAGTVIKNRLISHCRKVTKTQGPLEYMDAPQTSGSDLTFADTLPDKDYHALSDTDTFFFLSEAGKRYSGVAGKGIDALALKCRGHTGVEIAALYGVSANHVAAWISRASQKLRKDLQAAS